MVTKKTRPTIRQVAERAGVSHQTVSRFLRDDGGLKPATHERVLAAVQELGYRPDLLARSMRTGRSGILAIVLPGFGQDGRPVPVTTLRGAFEVAQGAGYRVEVVFEEGPGGDLAARATELLDSGMVEGVLALTTIDEGALSSDLVGAGPFVLAAAYDEQLRAAGQSSQDLVTMVQIVDRLVDWGHRHFLHVAGPAGWISADQRRHGYEQAIEKHAVTSHGTLIGEWDAERGMAAVAELPADSPVSAIVCANDTIAIGALRAALKRGWDVPGRLSITGWDGQRLGEYSTPSLSTVEVDRISAGRHAMRKLIAAVRGETEPQAPDIKLTKIVFRESTGPAPTA